VNGLIRSESAKGICRVLCFSPRHDLTLTDMEIPEIKQVLEAWRGEYETLGNDESISHVMIFENKGEMMGTSNPHPHCQIWATSDIPTIPLQELKAQNQYYAAHSRPLLMDYLTWELEQRERIVTENSHWVALVPYWAAWPFEVMVLPRRDAGSIPDLSQDEIYSWAQLLKDLLGRYDNLFGVSFPYSMGIFQRPTKHERSPGFVMHQTFMPPLLRSARVRKFMVGFELCAEAQRDLTPELAATSLREALPRPRR
jgi:UDPglucose--hexose-1-phosphate uridylyltransferase